MTLSTSEVPRGPLQLHVFPGPDCRGELYWDDGISMKGPILRQTVRCTQGKDGLMLHFDRREGTYKPWWKQIEVWVHGWNGPARVRANGRTLRSIWGEGAQAVAFTVPDQARPSDIVISRF